MNIYGLILLLYFSLSLTGQNLFKEGYTQENQINNEISKASKFLGIQYSNSGSISLINTTFTIKFTDLSNQTILSSDRLNTFHLKLTDVSHKTILLSYYPLTINTSINTSSFIDKWINNENYKVNKPSAILVIDDENVNPIKLQELSTPIYSKGSNLLQYNFETFGNQTSFDFPFEFEQSTLIIKFN